MKHIFSVTQINSYIHRIFESDYALKKIYLKGEVSNCKYHSSGHIYFTLKDEKSALRCVMFSSDRYKGLTFHLEDGQLIEACGNISVYEQTGTYQMYVRKIELSGAGELYIRYEQLKQELAQKGYFDFERKKPLPPYPEKIGIVTALTGAAIEDIKSIAKRRNPSVQLYLYPSKVQGEGAAAQISRGIRYFDTAGVDIIIIGRGGGSIEDLWAFNEEIVARAIFDCRTPIISAVGHETDWTIADFVSDRRAPTPSAAAELAVSDYRQTLERLDNLRRRMDRNLTGRIDFFMEKLSHIKTRLNFLSPQNKLNENKRRLADIEDALERIMKQRLSDCRQRLALLSGTLDAYSPAKKLAQGYAYVEVEKKGALHSVSDINAGDDINIYLIDGHARAVVSEVINDEQRK